MYTHDEWNLIFDMDGVLVDSEPVITAAAAAGLSEYGVTAKHADFKPFTGMGEDIFIGKVAEKYGLVYKHEMKKRVYEIYLEIVADNLTVYPGICEMLLELSARGWKMALASSADKVKIDANLRVAGINPDVFSAIISGNDVAAKKPAPDIFLVAAKLIEARPERCIVVEDAISGIKAALSAGMKCIAVTTSFDRYRLIPARPDNIVRKTTDIMDLLD